MDGAAEATLAQHKPRPMDRTRGASTSRNNRRRIYRRTVVVILVTACLAAGCGGAGASDETTGSSPQGGAASTGRTVVLEVAGTGTTDIYYHAETNETVKKAPLPWSKTVVLELTGAERTSGRLVSITPGSVRAANGQYVAAQCRIVVDGAEVANNRAGESTCQHLLK